MIGSPTWVEVLRVGRFNIPYGVKLHSEYGLEWFNSYANDEPQDSLGVKIIPVIALGIIGILGIGTAISAGATALVQPEPSAFNNPKNMLIIPGINRFIPLSAAFYVVVTMLISVAFHELMHAIYGLKHGCEIEGYGILTIGPIPLGAYVEPEEESHINLPPWPKMEVFASAPLSNLWLAGLFYSVGAWFPGTPNDATLAAGYQEWVTALNAGELTSFVPVYGHPITDMCVWGFALSLNLGLFNLLPIKPLDGGQVLDAAIKGVSEKAGVKSIGSKLSNLTTYAVVLLLAFVLFAPFLL